MEQHPRLQTGAAAAAGIHAFTGVPRHWMWRRNKKMSFRCLDSLRHKVVWTEEGSSWPSGNLNRKPGRVDAQQQGLSDKLPGPLHTPPADLFLCHANANAAAITHAVAGEHHPGLTTVQTVLQLCESGQLSRAVDALAGGLSLRREKTPSRRVLVWVLSRLILRCGAVNNLGLGRRLDDLTVELGYGSNPFLGNHMFRMYSGQGRLHEAMQVFARVSKPSAFMWFSMISAHAKQGDPRRAIELYHEMVRAGGAPNALIFAAALQACAWAEDVESGRRVHAHLLASGSAASDAVVLNCLVDMYAKCGQLEDARRVFDGLEAARRDAVTWNAMINGYAARGCGPQALALYARMEQEGMVAATEVTFVCLLKACASAGALQQGRQLHAQVVARGMLLDGADDAVVLGTCVVDMYAKCGRLGDARLVFDGLASRDVVTWNAMIGGCGTNNEGHKAVACFEEMVRAGVRPDAATFTCLLVACSHEGLVSEGRRYFDGMVERHGVSPTTEHLNCMVDLLGRAGRTAEAHQVLLAGPPSGETSNNNAVGLMSLLHACKSHGDIDLGAHCFQCLVDLDAHNAAAYVLMASAYADAERWADVDRIQRLRKLAGASKKPAVAGIEVNKQVHTFVVGDHRRDDSVSCKVQSTSVRLKDEGNHVPHTESVLKPGMVSEAEKETDLCGHAEKLALAYGLLHTPDGAPLLVTKNLRMCGDCHSATEVLSRVEKREIVVRDAYRVHRFEAGSCSCKGRC